jgi:hypothetical protein
MMKTLPSCTKHSCGKPSCLTPNNLIDKPRNLARMVTFSSQELTARKMQSYNQHSFCNNKVSGLPFLPSYTIFE